MAQLWYITQCPANRNYLGSVINFAVLMPGLKVAFSDWPNIFFSFFFFLIEGLQATGHFPRVPGFPQPV